MKYLSFENLVMDCYSLPKFLFKNNYSELSLNAKVIYAFLYEKYKCDRSIDTTGKIFIKFKRKDLSKMIGISERTVQSAIKDLKMYKLLEEINLGQHEPNHIFLLVPYEMDKNNRESKEIEFDDKFSSILKRIKKQIYYDEIVNPYNLDLINEVVGILVDLNLSESEFITIDGEKKSRQLVLKTFNGITYENILYVIEKFKEQTQEIKKKKQYIISILYNSFLEQNFHYTNQIRKLI